MAGTERLSSAGNGTVALLRENMTVRRLLTLRPRLGRLVNGGRKVVLRDSILRF